MDTSTQERLQLTINAMQEQSDRFYADAIRIGNHPFIEFTGLINEYITCCRQSLKDGIDFTQCSTHQNLNLPMREHNIDYINEKLECIFTGRSVMAPMNSTTQAAGGG